MKCAKCKKDIPRKEYLACSECKAILDLQCANVSFTRFTMMNADRKKTWKCTTCLSKSKKDKSMTQNNMSLTTKASHSTSLIVNESINRTNQNVTTRLRNKPRASSVELLDKSTEESFEYNSSLDNTHLSLPDLKIANDRELHDEIDMLKTQLASAHSEIERLNMELTHLQREFNGQQKKSQVLKQILTEPTTVRKSTPLKISYKKKLVHLITNPNEFLFKKKSRKL